MGLVAAGKAEWDVLHAHHAHVIMKAYAPFNLLISKARGTSSSTELNPIIPSQYLPPFSTGFQHVQPSPTLTYLALILPSECIQVPHPCS